MNNLLTARIIRVNYTQYLAEHNQTIYQLQLSGRLQYILTSKDDYPTVGDVVDFRQSNPKEGIIERLHERRSVLKRVATTQDYQEQLLATNVDRVLICLSMNEDFHKKKLSQLISLATSQHIPYEIVLTKSDLTKTPSIYIEGVEQVIGKTPLVVSIYDEASLDQLKETINDQTIVLIGSSGVGKSSLINALLDDEYLKVQSIRLSDAQGRHTTTHREMVSLPSGGAIIDTPGIRIIHASSSDVDGTFEDILTLALSCKFRDCQHQSEPQCAVKTAIDEGDLTEERLDAYHHMLRVQDYYKRRAEQKERIQQNK